MEYNLFLEQNDRLYKYVVQEMDEGAAARRSMGKKGHTKRRRRPGEPALPAAQQAPALTVQEAAGGGRSTKSGRGQSQTLKMQKHCWRCRS